MLLMFGVLAELWASFRYVPVHVLQALESLVRYILGANQQKYMRGDAADILRPLLGNSLPTMNGETWQRRRKVMQPAFNHGHLSEATQLMVETIAETCSAWEPIAARGGAVEVTHEMTLLSGRLLARVMFGHDMNENPNDLAHALLTIFDYLYGRAFSFVRVPEWLPTARRRRYREQLQWFHDAVDAIVEKRMRERGDRLDLLAMLMDARDAETGARLSVREIHDEVTAMLVGGYDSTSIALAFTFYLLWKHPHVLRRLRAELDEVLAGRAPTFEDLSRLRYTRMVFEEAMRLYPPSWCNVRISLGDDVIGGYHIPPNSAILFSPHVIHRLSAYWDAPDVFDPERFAPERASERPLYAYLPFGGGKRMCAGVNLAMMEGQLVTAMVMQRYDLNLIVGHPIELRPLVTMWPKHGIKMRLSPRARD